MTESGYEVVGRGVAIFKQKTSKFWWCSITIEEQGKKQYIRKSTKETERFEAIEKAIEMKLSLKIKQENNIPLIDNSPSFKKICSLLIKEYDKKKVQRSTYRTYKLHWNRLIEHFGNKRIDLINTFNIIEFFEEYEIESKTQITTARTAIKKVYEYALFRNLIRKIDIPVLPKIEKKKEEERDYFDKTDLKIFFDNDKMKKFIESGRKKLTRDIRKIFFLYCQWIWKTGVRAGTESQGIKYKHLKFTGKNNNRQYGHFAHTEDITLKIEEGKISEKNKREIPLSLDIHYIFIQLDLIRNSDSEELIRNKADRYLFRVNQNQIINFLDTFNQYKKFLKDNYEYNLGKEKTLYSFRHTYITEKLLSGIDVATVASATGTSLEMINKHYNKMTALMKKDELTRIEFDEGR